MANNEKEVEVQKAPVDLVQDLDSFKRMYERVKEAQRRFAEYTQEQVDEIFRAAAIVDFLALG